MASFLKYSPKLKLPSISKKVWWRLVKPTFSRSLCLPPARTHFCAVVAREYSRFSSPRNTSLNWFIPAFVNSRVASPCGTSDELRTRRWPWPSAPFLLSKNCKNFSRISLPVIFICVPLPGTVFSVPFPGTSAPVLRDSISRLSQTPQTPATKPEWHRLQPVLLNRLMSRLPQDPYGLIPAHVIDIGAKQSHSRGLP